MRGILKGFLYLVYLVIVGGLLAAIILTFHHDSVTAPQPPKPGQHQTASAPKKAAPSQPKSGPKSGSTRPSTGSNLTNTGPGDTVGLFVLAALAGAYLHRRALINRQT